MPSTATTSVPRPPSVDVTKDNDATTVGSPDRSPGRSRRKTGMAVAVVDSQVFNGTTTTATKSSLMCYSSNSSKNNMSDNNRSVDLTQSESERLDANDRHDDHQVVVDGGEVMVNDLDRTVNCSECDLNNGAIVVDADENDVHASSESAAAPAAASTQNSSPPSSSNNDATTRRSVGFGNITIHEFPIIIGDNPAVCSGPPVTIDWAPVYDNENDDGDTYDCYNCKHRPSVVSVDDYEKHRPTPRVKSELNMPPSYRTELLRRQGYSRREILHGSKTAAVIRGRRRRTNETMHFSAVHELLERIQRSILNATVRRSAKAAERRMLANCVSGSPAGSGDGGNNKSQGILTRNKNYTNRNRSRSDSTSIWTSHDAVVLKSLSTPTSLPKQNRSTPFTEDGSNSSLDDGDDLRPQVSLEGGI